MSKAKKQQKRRKNKGNGVRFKPLPETMDVSLVSTYKWNTTVSVGAITNAYANVSDANEFQPYYYDQLMTIYKNFVVMAVEIEYRIVNRSPSYEAEVILCEINRKNYDSGITWVIAGSLPGAQRYMLTSTGNQKALTCKRRIDLKHFYKGGFASDSDFWGDFYTSPPICTDTTRKDNIFSLLVYGAANGSDTVYYTTDRRITYHIRLFNFWASNISLLTDTLAVEDTESRPKKVAKPDAHLKAQNRSGMPLTQRRDDRPPEACSRSTTTFIRESDDDEGAVEVIPPTASSTVGRQGARRLAR